MFSYESASFLLYLRTFSHVLIVCLVSESIFRSSHARISVIHFLSSATTPSRQLNFGTGLSLSFLFGERNAFCLLPSLLFVLLRLFISEFFRFSH